MNSEQVPGLPGVRCGAESGETGFLGGVLGGASCRCVCGGEDGMGATASDANTGRAGNEGAFRATFDDGRCVRGFGSFATASSSSEDSLEGCSPRSRLRLAFAASRRFNETCAFLASRSVRWRASTSSDSRGSVAVPVRAHAGVTKFLKGFFAGTVVEADVDGVVDGIADGKSESATTAPGTKPGWQAEAGNKEAIGSDLKRARGSDDWGCLEDDIDLEERDGPACDPFADASTSKPGHSGKNGLLNEREARNQTTYLTRVPKMGVF